MAARSQPRSTAPRSTPSVSSTNKGPQKPVVSSLAKRLLFPFHPSPDLPPLLSSPLTPPELTEELYDFIALALRAFINPWWTKITRYDKEFLPEITRILTTVIRALEERLVAADLSPLLLQDIPTLITQHYCDYRNAQAKLSTSYASGGSTSLAYLFHQSQPHMALSEDGSIDPEYFRQIVDYILKTCLPPEDYTPESERFIVREIILKVVLNDVIPKITQPWFIQKVLFDQIVRTSDAIPTLSKQTEPAAPLPAQSFSFHNLLVIFLSAVQAFSGACLALIHVYKQAASTIKQCQVQPSSRPAILEPTSPLVSPSLSGSSSPSSSDHVPSSDFQDMIIDPEVYIQSSLTMISEIFSTSDRFAAGLIMSSVGIISISMTRLLDQLLPHLLYTSLSHHTLTTIVRTAKRTLFPNGYPGPAPPDPTPEEQAVMRRQLMEWAPSGGAARVVPIFLGPDTPSTIAAALDPLSSGPCNVHLVFMIFDRVLLTLFPELGVDRKRSG